jgi:hypothetical protein
MLVGVDFDNTIVCYDRVFHKIALEQGLIPADVPVSKGSVRDYLRQVGREEHWIELQGYVYGARMRDALSFPGVLEFFIYCKQRGITVYIISHKTRYPFRGPVYDLHRAAQEWLDIYGFYDPSRIGLSPQQVYFELTKEEKLERIAKVGCTHFVDDLPEFLAESSFPDGVERILFDPNDNCTEYHRFHRANSWRDIQEIIKCGTKAP